MKVGGALVAALVVLCASGCCDPAARGTLCLDSSSAGDVSEVRVVSPALECHSRLCLVTPREAGPMALCTIECSSDDDCGMVDLDCRSGSVCARLPPYPRAVCTCR